MNNAFIQLRHFAASLQTGITERTDCPWCGGGSEHEAAFAVTRISEAEAKYCCHRASCGRAGRIAVWGFTTRQVVDNSAQKGREFAPRVHTADTRELGEKWAAELLDLYEIWRSEPVELGWLEEVDSGNLVVPVRSSLGVLRGVEVRRSKIQGPYAKGAKTLTHRVLDEPWLGWYRAISTGPTIVLEDPISALKVSRHFQVVCLHGSHISLDMLLELIGVVGNADMVLALDKDATSKALKFIVEWRFLAPNFRAIPLSKDLKYESDKRILELCNG